MKKHVLTPKYSQLQCGIDITWFDPLPVTEPYFVTFSIYVVAFALNLSGIEWPFMYWCAVKKLLTHFDTVLLRVKQLQVLFIVWMRYSMPRSHCLYVEIVLKMFHVSGGNGRMWIRRVDHSLVDSGHSAVEVQLQMITHGLNYKLITVIISQKNVMLIKWLGKLVLVSRLNKHLFYSYIHIFTNTTLHRTVLHITTVLYSSPVTSQNSTARFTSYNTTAWSTVDAWQCTVTC